MLKNLLTTYDLQSVVKKGSTSLFCGFAIRLYNNPKMKKGKENET